MDISQFLNRYYDGIFQPLYGQTGPCGIILLFVAGACIYLIIKNFIYLYWIQKNFTKAATKTKEKAGDPNAMAKARNKNPLCAIIYDIATHHANHSEDMRSGVAYLFHYHFKGIIGEITLLKLFSVISPLLGLMGTVLGMIEVFKVVSTQTSANPALLAGGIWEALITTIMGLAVAVPALVFHHLLSLKMRGLQLTALEYGYRAGKIFNFSVQHPSDGPAAGIAKASEPGQILNMRPGMEPDRLEVQSERPSL